MFFLSHFRSQNRDFWHRKHVRRNSPCFLVYAMLPVTLCPEKDRQKHCAVMAAVTGKEISRQSEGGAQWMIRNTKRNAGKISLTKWMRYRREDLTNEPAHSRMARNRREYTGALMVAHKQRNGFYLFLASNVAFI